MSPPGHRQPHRHRPPRQTASQTTSQTGNGNDHQPSTTEPSTTDLDHSTGPAGPTDDPAGDQTGAESTSIDPERFRYWRQITSAMPPMTPEEIAATGLILRRIDARINAGIRPSIGR